MENNPIDSFKVVVQGTANKKDLLIFNLKMTPVMLMINTYDQLIAEAIQAINTD